MAKLIQHITLPTDKISTSETFRLLHQPVSEPLIILVFCFPVFVLDLGRIWGEVCRQ